MRIVVMGQGPFAAEVMAKLAGRGDDVVGVYTTADRRGEPVQEAMVRLGKPVFRPASLRPREVYENYANLKPDLLVMAFVTDIVPERFFLLPGKGAIQYHPSLLPRHRGGSAINWAIIQGETTTGLTIFWPDKGIDTGSILLQRSVAISPDDTVGSLYFNKLYPLGVAALLEAISLVKEGKAPRQPQDETAAIYEGLCSEADAIVDWAQPLPAVFNLIRGTDPQPGATTLWHGRKLRLFGAQVAPGIKGKPGRIQVVDEVGIIIAAGEGAIRVTRIQPEGGAKMASREYAASVGLGEGDLLGR